MTLCIKHHRAPNQLDYSSTDQKKKKNISMDPVHAKRNPWLIKPQKVGLLQILYMTLVSNHDQHACTKSTATLKLQNQTNLER